MRQPTQRGAARARMRESGGGAPRTGPSARTTGVAVPPWWPHALDGRVATYGAVLRHEALQLCRKLLLGRTSQSRRVSFESRYGM